MRGLDHRRIQRRRLTTSPDALPVDWHPVLRRVYAARGVTHARELDTSLRSLPPPYGLPGITQAAALLAAAVQAGERILVVGDFDADGATSSALAVRALRAMGAVAVDYLVPNRFEYGYGLTPELVAEARNLAPDVIVTVDNGISSTDGVAAAHAAGMRVLVTDHHLPGEALPDAEAIVNPNIPGSDFPSTALAGVGVIFYVMAALRGHLEAAGWFTAPNGRDVPNLAAFLDLVAVGTVADVVPLDRTNRTLVHQGLARLHAGQGSVGVHALLAVANREPSHALAADLGFAVGPRLNAAGRLDDMSPGIECLLTDNPERARELAEQLDQYNRERRSIEGRMKDEAMGHVAALEEQLDGHALPSGICLMDPAWHQGVIGIVAARVRERFHRPVLAFAPDGDGGLKGSARSIPGVHMRDLLARVDSCHPGIIRRFGGHAMAAGLSLSSDVYERFRAVFEATAQAWIDADDLAETVPTDGPLEPGDHSLALARTLRAGGPWGQAFPEPVFDGAFRIRERRVVGETHLKLRVQAPEGGPELDAIAFRALEHGWDSLADEVHLVYRLEANRFRGTERLQLIVIDMQPDR